VLFCWATVPMLEDALEWMAAYGFAYRSHCVWIKPHAGTGYWFRNQHELLLADAEFSELVAPVTNNGLQEKIMLSSDKSTIVDGRNRFLACAAAQVSPSFRELPDAFSEEKTIQFIIAANLHRRQLTVGQRAALGVGIEEALAKVTRRGRPENGKKVTTSSELSSSLSRDKAAKQVGVGTTAIQQAKKVKEVSPALFQQVVAGTTTLNEAHKKAKAEEKAKMADQPAGRPGRAREGDRQDPDPSADRARDIPSGVPRGNPAGAGEYRRSRAGAAASRGGSRQRHGDHLPAGAGFEGMAPLGAGPSRCWPGCRCRWSRGAWG
jgi:hypothetical protein